MLFVVSALSAVLKVVRRMGELSESVRSRRSVGSVEAPEVGSRRLNRAKRLLLVLLALDLLLMVGAVATAVRLKLSRASFGDEESDEFDFTTIFGGIEFESRAEAFRDGAWLAYFGGGELDLSGAELDPGGATLRVRAMMGGGEIVVPPDCRVEMHSRGVMGGVQNDAGEIEAVGGPTLVIEASSLMGGFHIVRGEGARGEQATSLASEAATV